METTLPYDDWQQKPPAERDKEIHSCLCGIKTLLEELPVGGVESVTATNDSIVVNNTDPLNPTVGLPYKVYRALLTQSGTEAPTATVLENTFGEVPTFLFNDTGKFLLSTVGNVFTPNKTFVIVRNPNMTDTSDPVYFFYTGYVDAQNIRLITLSLDGDTGIFMPINGVLVNTEIQILVYQ